MFILSLQKHLEMSTFLFDSTIFGPVKSRRLGISLGINLLPNTRKICNFNCIYCECGWNPEAKEKEQLPQAGQVVMLLEKKLGEMKENKEKLDVITFAGNGEPTMHPEFDQIIDDTIRLRNQYFPKVKISVLSNATLVFKEKIFNTLKKVDNNILKLDSAIESTCCTLNKPTGYFNVKELIDSLARFEGKMILQTMFVRGNYNGTIIDNTSEVEVMAWLEAIKKINPGQVMIYTIARDTPVENLEKVPLSVLKDIAAKVEGIGIKVSISG